MDATSGYEMFSFCNRSFVFYTFGRIISHFVIHYTSYEHIEQNRFIREAIASL